MQKDSYSPVITTQPTPADLRRHERPPAEARSLGSPQRRAGEGHFGAGDVVNGKLNDEDFPPVEVRIRTRSDMKDG